MSKTGDATRMVLFKQGSGRGAFSLIEVILALLVLGIGMIAVLQLLPIGISSRRNALVENYASHSADSLLHELKVVLKDPAQNYQNWEELGQTLPEGRSEIATGAGDWAEVSAWSSPDMKLFVPSEAAPDTQGDVPDAISLMKVEHGNPASGTSDFSALYRIWREPVSYYPYDQDEGEWADSPVQVTSDVAMALNVEVSWPPEIPFEGRKRAHFYIEVFKGDSE